MLYTCTHFSQIVKNETFQKTFDIFLIFAQNIDCGYMLEPPRRSKNKKKYVYSCKPQFFFNWVHVYENPTIWVPTRPDTNQPVHAQKMVRGWKFWIKEEEDLYYPCSEIKGADHLCSTAQLICALVFAYADCWFSHAVVHIKVGFMGVYFSLTCFRDGDSLSSSVFVS